MSWNYRIIKTEVDGHAGFALHEVYYADDGIVKGYTEDPVRVVSDHASEIPEILAMMLKATTLPVMEDRDGKLAEFTPAEQISLIHGEAQAGRA